MAERYQGQYDLGTRRRIGTGVPKAPRSYSLYEREVKSDARLNIRVAARTTTIGLIPIQPA